VSEAEKLYGREIYVYNVHNLVHLANDVKHLGTLDNFSCFPLENKLGQLKKLVRKPQFLIQQLVNRLAEKEQVRTEKSDEVRVFPLLKSEHHNGPFSLLLLIVGNTNNCTLRGIQSHLQQETIALLLPMDSQFWPKTYLKKMALFFCYVRSSSLQKMHLIIHYHRQSWKFSKLQMK